MADPRVLVVGAVLHRRHLLTSTVPGLRLATESRTDLGGAGALAALAAAETAAETGVEVVLVGGVGDDDPGRRCADALRVDRLRARLSHEGTTGEHLVLDVGTGVDDELLVLPDGGPADIPAAVEELAACRPGDALLVDAPTAARRPDLLRAAYDADVQLVLDLHPMLSEAFSDATALADVAVVDAAGAVAVADAAMPPASLAVHAAFGSWWDDLRHEPARILPPDPDATHRFAGALTAALAAGLDRPEAFDLAVRTATSGTPHLL
ncbi:hypothetical protein [Mobilicoccus pelagius]|uniref:Carbohydrate kinase PfkB domain-containing protein n=1 Tax=Mobilicoccus pelagius NBRC 104925 TaxID=1089455 RepID=H5UQD9_9MICO|nr:hypothetical protein [Mobilicoccus pelagius]GAB47947.1 hypothetical protein MOPEL_031_00490 [Mobilicoccus pelagius NBRC 104925]